MAAKHFDNQGNSNNNGNAYFCKKGKFEDYIFGPP